MGVKATTSKHLQGPPVVALTKFNDWLFAVADLIYMYKGNRHIKRFMLISSIVIVKNNPDLQNDRLIFYLTNTQASLDATEFITYHAI